LLSYLEHVMNSESLNIFTDLVILDADQRKKK